MNAPPSTYLISSLYLQLPNVTKLQEYTLTPSASNVFVNPLLSKIVFASPLFCRSDFQLQIFFKENYELAEANFSQKAVEMANNFQKSQELAEQEYLKVLADMTKEVSTKLVEYREELSGLEYEIAEKYIDMCKKTW